MKFYNDTSPFFDKGYFILKQRIPTELVSLGIEGSNQIVASARRGNASNTRIYRDYPHIFGGLNIFGVESLMHPSIKSNKFNKLIQSLDLEKMVLEATGWKGTFCTLIRIHTASPLWKYQGTWHRDAEVDNNNSIHLNIYLKDEKGFRIVPENQQFLLKDRQINEVELCSNDNILLSDDLYDEISAKAGDILFFKSSLLHQGVYSGQRRHIHICFKREEENMKDHVTRLCNINFRKDCDPTKTGIQLNTSNQIHNHNFFEDPASGIRNFLTQLNKALKRGFRLANYLIPLLRIIRDRHLIIQLRSKNFRYSLSSNTIWQ